MASLAEMERELIVERMRAGLDVARQLGRKGGRKRQMTDSKIVSAKKLLVSGVPPKDVAKNLGVSIPTTQSDRVFRVVSDRSMMLSRRRPLGVDLIQMAAGDTTACFTPICWPTSTMRPNDD